MLEKKQSGRAATAKLIGGVLFIDFINSVGARVKIAPTKSSIEADKILDYEDLLLWSEHTKILSAPEAEKLKTFAVKNGYAAANVFKRAVNLRESLYKIAVSLLNKSEINQKDLRIVNTELQIAQDNRRLEQSEGKVILSWQTASLEPDKMLWAIIQSAADYLARGEYQNLRECVNQKCGWLFEDTSRNRRRSWCDMQDCGNLDKVRRFRARAAKVT